MRTGTQQGGGWSFLGCTLGRALQLFQFCLFFSEPWRLRFKLLEGSRSVNHAASKALGYPVQDKPPRQALQCEVHRPRQKLDAWRKTAHVQSGQTWTRMASGTLKSKRAPPQCMIGRRWRSQRAQMLHSPAEISIARQAGRPRRHRNLLLRRRWLCAALRSPDICRPAAHLPRSSLT